jgi:histidine ammonia-lyase
MRVLAHPASVDSVSTSAAQEDHVSMGMASARKVRRSVALLEGILAIEMLCAAQAVEYRRPLQSSPTVEEALARIRDEVRPLDEDRVLSGDIEALRRLIRTGALSFGDRG